MTARDLRDPTPGPGDYRVTFFNKNIKLFAMIVDDADSIADAQITAQMEFRRRHGKSLFECGDRMVSELIKPRRRET